MNEQINDFAAKFFSKYMQENKGRIEKVKRERRKRGTEKGVCHTPLLYLVPFASY